MESTSTWEELKSKPLPGRLFLAAILNRGVGFCCCSSSSSSSSSSSASSSFLLLLLLLLLLLVGVVVAVVVVAVVVAAVYLDVSKKNTAFFRGY